MKTEIGFLLDLLLEHKLPKDTKAICLARIREIEESISKPEIIMGVRPFIAPQPQAPSTRAILEKQMQEAQQGAIQPPISPVPLSAPILQRAEIDKETGRAMVATGNGTKGPRKF